MTKRSFFDELTELESTWHKVEHSGINIPRQLDSNWLTGSIFCIASGGSLSIARMWQNAHENLGLGIAKTITPYEFFHTNSKAEIVALFSASGNNHDILQVFRIALTKGYRILVVTVSKNSKLLRSAKTNSPQSIAVFPYAGIPKDGFLAVNSVVAMSCVLKELTKNIFQANLETRSPIKKALKDHVDAENSYHGFVNIRTTQILTSEWGIPAGIDLESRFAESGIGNCFLTDPRNFGHGRFIWIDKWIESSLILLINTPESKRFIKRFLKAVPDNANILNFNSPFNGIYGSIYCIIRSILFFGFLAKQQEIDPGKPVVSQWGKKIHKLYYIKRSVQNKGPVRRGRQKKYPAEAANFSAIVLDFDGTIVDTNKRYDPIRPEIVNELVRLLNQGIKIGIATGRGLSAFKELKKEIPSRLQKNVLVGLYNGSILKNLSSASQLSESYWPIKKLIMELVEQNPPSGITVSAKITNISLRDGAAIKRKQYLQELMSSLGQFSCFTKCQTSGHSIDISPNWASKLLVIQGLVESLNEQILCIGDQGQANGNDEELLSWIPSISVGRKCPASQLCLWIGKDDQYRESLGTLTILKCIQKNNSKFMLNLESLHTIS